MPHLCYAGNCGLLAVFRVEGSNRPLADDPTVAYACAFHRLELMAEMADYYTHVTWADFTEEDASA